MRLEIHKLPQNCERHRRSPAIEANLGARSIAAHQARWDAADAEIGYSRTDELIQRSEQALLDDLALSPACSVEAATTKAASMLVVRAAAAVAAAVVVVPTDTGTA
ncbi:hypothetical protein [Mesorhizobium sp. B2-3-5]|uniref:hypothetical protein n=1 Tax=Mesorhizobium sp. B2-3-5 TaxID=2589958 RepID=UPI0015E2AC4F|nr:hypothetical protein [Mesorhizobium sp. B2-3-5]